MPISLDRQMAEITSAYGQYCSDPARGLIVSLTFLTKWAGSHPPADQMVQKETADAQRDSSTKR
jgi:hypothetical protein